MADYQMTLSFGSSVIHIPVLPEKLTVKSPGKNETATVLELGEVSGAIPLELVSCWDWAVNRTELLRGAPLKIETLPAVTHCEGCGENYPTVRHGRTCPYCGSEKTWLLRGNEISIKEIEAI